MKTLLAVAALSAALSASGGAFADPDHDGPKPHAPKHQSHKGDHDKGDHDKDHGHDHD